MRTAPFRPRLGLPLLFGLALSAHIVDSVVDGVAAPRPWWRLLLAMSASYFLCICIHDAVHGVLVRQRWLNQVGGVIFGLFIGLPFPLLQRAHLHHHGRVGHDDDPEAVVYRSPLWQLPLRLPFIPFFYLRTMSRLSWLERTVVVAHVAVVVSIVVVAEARGVPLLTTWALPTLASVMWFGFTTVWVPHGPNAAAMMRVFNAHSGWHDDHHADTRYPFPQYAELRAHHLAVGTTQPVSAGEARRTTRLGTRMCSDGG